MPEKNTILLICAFLAGATIASTIPYLDSEDPPALTQTPVIPRLESQLGRLETKLDNLKMEISTAYTYNSRSNQNSRLLGTHEVAAGVAAIEKKQPITLSDAQKTLFERLSQNIEYASDGGFTMDQLVEQMKDLPDEYRDKLIGQVAAKVNNQTLDPRLFMEGKR